MDPSRKVSTIYARGSHGPATSELSLRRRSSRVLVVDDNPNTMRLMEELLSSRGYDVVALLDAAQAEAEILRRAPDLVLSDVVMPGKSGYELCRELKENPATRLIPFVLITGLAEREDRGGRRRFFEQAHFSRRIVCQSEIAAEAQRIH